VESRTGSAEPAGRFEEHRNLGGRLTTVTGRVCPDPLRSRPARREEPMDDTLGFTEGRLTGRYVLADPERLARLAVPRLAG
jgi:RNA polymerase sigma-70 factor (ECF subfamily)